MSQIPEPKNDLEVVRGLVQLPGAPTTMDWIEK